MASLLWGLPDTCHSRTPGRVDTAPIAVGAVDAVEAVWEASGAVVSARHWSRLGGENCLQRPRPLAAQPQSDHLPSSAQRLLRRTQPTSPRSLVAVAPTEPPCTDPYARWCGRGERVTAPPMPIAGAGGTAGLAYLLDTSDRSVGDSPPDPRSAIGRSDADIQTAASFAPARISVAAVRHRHCRPGLFVSCFGQTRSTCKRGVHSAHAARSPSSPQPVCSQALRVF
jgi:hypothetical protein